MDNIKAVVFDCDGVMFNSQKANLDFYNTILEHFAVVPVTHEYPDKVKLCHTASSPQVLLGLLGADLGRAAIEYAQQVDYDQFIPQLQMEDGLIELLPQLLQHFKLAVATNRGDSMLKILDYFELSNYFDTVLTYLDVSKPKPSPDMLLEVASRLVLKPDELLFVGDSELDMLAAQAAECPFVSYKWDGGLRIDHHCQLLQILRHDQLV